MTPDEIALAEGRADGALAASLKFTKIVSREIGRGAILAAMAPNGGLFLRGLRELGATRPGNAETANVEECVGLIDIGQFDVGMPATRSQLQAFAEANQDMAPAINALLALAEVVATPSVDQVSAILNSET